MDSCCAAFTSKQSEQDFNAIAKARWRLNHARRKHPASEWQGKGRFWALGELGSEFDEVVHAVEHEGDDRMIDELLDLIAVAIRMIQREYE